MFGADTRGRNLLLSFARLQRDYGARVAAIDAAAERLNRSLTPVAPGA
jgi:hypothetical protein